MRVEGESWKGFRDLAPGKTNTCGHNVMILLEAMVGVLTSFSSVMTAARFLCRADDYEPLSLLPRVDAESPCSSAMFLASSVRPNLASLWKPEWFLHPVPQKA